MNAVRSHPISIGLALAAGLALGLAGALANWSTGGLYLAALALILALGIGALAAEGRRGRTGTGAHPAARGR